MIAKLSPVILPPLTPQTQRQTAITINRNIRILHVDNSRCRLGRGTIRTAGKDAVSLRCRASKIDYRV
ncbi:hypothetical protein ACLK1X_06705 [Escherichia coli]